jgi:hypothetical protein
LTNNERLRTAAHARCPQSRCANLVRFRP